MKIFSSCSCNFGQEVPIFESRRELKVSIMSAQINHQGKSNNIRSLFTTFVRTQPSSTCEKSETSHGELSPIEISPQTEIRTVKK